MNTVQKDFIKVLKEWKEGNWVLFTSQSARESRKRFWCNLNGQYKVTLKSNEKPLYQGNDMEKASEIYYML